MSRLAAKVRCNYYPLPLREAERIRGLVQFPSEPFSALDPCVGEGISELLEAEKIRVTGSGTRSSASSRSSDGSQAAEASTSDGSCFQYARS